jgi:lipoyl(octanoyl) transferase
MADLTMIRAGMIDYAEAWDWQKQLHAQRIADEIQDTALLLEHPSVYTGTPL